MIHHLARLLSLVGCLILSCSLALAQNDDPFGANPANNAPDPFGAPDPFSDPADDDPFGPDLGKPNRKPIPAKGQAAKKQDRGPSVKLEIRDKPAIAEDESKTNEAVVAALKQRVEIEMDGNSIEDLAGAIHHRFEIPVQIDRTSMALAGVNPEDRTLKLKQERKPLFEVLSTVLRDKGLSFAVWNGVLWICGPEFERNYRRRIYAVTDLVGDSQIDGRANSKEIRHQASGLQNLIMSSALPESWYQNKASISPVSFGADGVVLVIVQTVEGHLRVSRLLEDLRAARKKVSAR